MNNAPSSLEGRLLVLLHKAREDRDPVAREELNTLLRANAEARALLPLVLVDEQALMSLLREEEIKALIAPSTAAPEMLPGRDAAHWPAWRPFATAAAGLVFGVLCTSVVFACVMPVLEKPVTLLEASFENSEPPQPSGIPKSFNTWSGDFAEIAGAQDGVVPHGGAKMWRFLRADNALDTGTSAHYVGEAMYAMDLKPLRQAGVKAGRQIEISAWFAAGQTAPEQRYHWNIKAAAFEGNVTQAPDLWKKWDQASTSLAQREVVATGGPGHWQRVGVTMVLPANADYLVFECAVVQRKPAVSRGSADFPAHYVDDVRVRVLPLMREARAEE